MKHIQQLAIRIADDRSDSALKSTQPTICRQCYKNVVINFIFYVKSAQDATILNRHIPCRIYGIEQYSRKDVTLFVLIQLYISRVGIIMLVSMIQACNNHFQQPQWTTSKLGCAYVVILVNMVSIGRKRNNKLPHYYKQNFQKQQLIVYFKL